MLCGVMLLEFAMHVHNVAIYHAWLILTPGVVVLYMCVSFITGLCICVNYMCMCVLCIVGCVYVMLCDCML